MATKKTTRSGKRRKKSADEKPGKQKLVRVWTNLTEDEQVPRMRALAKKRGLHTDAAALSYALNFTCDEEEL